MSEYRFTDEQSEYIGPASDVQRARIQQVVSEALAAQREQIAAAIEALPGPNGEGISRWPEAARETYLLCIEEAATIAREATR